MERQAVLGLERVGAGRTVPQLEAWVVRVARAWWREWVRYGAAVSVPRGWR